MHHGRLRQESRHLRQRYRRGEEAESRQNIRGKSDEDVYKRQEQDIESGLCYLENFAPDIELQAFEEKVCCLVQNQMLVNIIDRALLRLKRYPDRGELYYEILTKQFIYRFNSTEKELLEELNIERSVFYDRKREAIYLFSVCLFGYSIPEVLEELPRLNSD